MPRPKGRGAATNAQATDKDTPHRPSPLEGPPPQTPDELHAWLVQHLGITFPRSPLLRDHATPFDYLVHSFFDGTFTKPRGARAVDRTNGALQPAQADAPLDCVVWANRGGGKTFLGAIATLLDLLFKPGIEIRILAGSLEQGRRLHTHLRRFFDNSRRPEFAELVAGKITHDRLALTNGSEVELLAASQTSVRGTRVQVLRCDEVDLFGEDLWEAAQLVTRSKTIELADGSSRVIPGKVECLSTMHLPHGLMHRVVSEARSGTRRLFRWGVVDVLESCPAQRPCRSEKNPQSPKQQTETPPGSNEDSAPALGEAPGEADEAPRDGDCPLWRECRGRAKLRPKSVAGHLTIDDAITMKRRVSMPTWEAEMLCLRPRRTDSVLPEFNPAVHVKEFDTAALRALSIRRVNNGSVPRLDSDHPLGIGWDLAGGRWLAGMDFGFRAPTVVLWAHCDEANVLRIVDEYVVRGAVMSQTIDVIHAGLARSIPGTGEVIPAWPAFSWIGVDPAGAQANDQSGDSNILLMQRSGLDVRARTSRTIEGLTLLRIRLQPADGQVRLFIHPRCTTLIESMEKYHYNPNSPDDESPEKDGPDHAVDALRYLVLNLDHPTRTTRSNYNVYPR